MWDTVNSNFWAAIAGAIVGGVLTIVMQRMERAAAKRERESTQLAERQATATSIVSKLVRMHRQLETLVRNHDVCAAGAEAGQEPWAYIRAIGVLPELASLTSAEAASLFQLDDQLFNEILLFADRYHVAVHSHSLYASERKALLEKLVPDRMVGIVGEIRAPEGVQRRTAADRASLNDMAVTMHRHNLANAAEGLDILRRLVGRLNSELSMKLRIGATLAVIAPSDP